MAKIKIITDSTADLSSNIVEKYSIEVLPLTVNFGLESYQDGVDIDFHKLIDKIKNEGVFPTTSQISPHRFYECFKSYVDEGFDVLYISIGSKFSGTYQSSCIAREMIDKGKIINIDSSNTTAGLGILVICAARMAEKGMSIEEIEEEVLKLIPKVHSTLSFNSLDHLIKGGRLSKTAGFIGNVLNIKPMLSIRDGEISVIDKVRGSKKALNYIVDDLYSHTIKKGTPLILLEAEGGDMYGELKDRLHSLDVEIIEQKVGCVVGTHSGPNAAGIFFIEE